MLNVPRFLRAPDFEKIEDNQIAVILSKIFYALLSAYIILFIARIAVKDWKETALLATGLSLIALAFSLLQLKRLRAAVLTLALVLLAQITIIAVMGQGIRDLAVVGFPSILIVSSLIMKRMDYLIMVWLTLLCLVLISVGPLAGVYRPLPPPPPNLADFFIVATITALAALMSHFLTANMRMNLRIAHEELRERKKTGQNLKRSLHEKELLLKEIHHRVKNNLTVIKSLLSLQKNQIQTPEQAIAAFTDMENRVLSIAQVHQQLYKSDDFNQISMKSYISTMTQNLKSIIAPRAGITFTHEIEDVELSIDLAVPCGIIINELITNALKHAFPGTDKGTITIGFCCLGSGSCQLKVTDNGVGLPGGITLNNPNSLGLKLVTILTEQLKGSIEVASDKGAAFIVTFPVA
ncbi:sensor histidine kinase [bacterium]|nr:sensor histidine kinase [bacterium]